MIICLFMLYYSAQLGTGLLYLFIILEEVTDMHCENSIFFLDSLV